MLKVFPDQAPRFDVALRDAKSKNARTRAYAIQSLANPPEGMRDAAVDALRPLLSDDDLTVRYSALAAIGEFDDVESLPKILSFFDDKAPSMRELAVIVASHFDDERAKLAVRNALRSEHPEMRFQAVLMCTERNDADAADTLAPLLADPDTHVRAEVALSLAALHDPRCADALLQLLHDREQASDAAMGLAELGETRALPALQSMSTKRLLPLHTHAAVGAARVMLGDRAGADELRGVLTAFRASARSYAADVAGIGSVIEVLPELERLVDSPRGADPRVVVKAIARLAQDHESAQTLLTKLGRRTDDIGHVARTINFADE